MKKFLKALWKCLFEYDKLWHLIAGFATTFLLSLPSFRFWGAATFWYSLIPALMLGIFKEMYDAQIGKSAKFNGWDLTFTVFGGLLAVGCLYLSLSAFT